MPLASVKCLCPEYQIGVCLRFSDEFRDLPQQPIRQISSPSEDIQFVGGFSHAQLTYKGRNIYHICIREQSLVTPEHVDRQDIHLKSNGVWFSTIMLLNKPGDL